MTLKIKTITAAVILVVNVFTASIVVARPNFTNKDVSIKASAKMVAEHLQNETKNIKTSLVAITKELKEFKKKRIAKGKDTVIYLKHLKKFEFVSSMDMGIALSERYLINAKAVIDQNNSIVSSIKEYLNNPKASTLNAVIVTHEVERQVRVWYSEAIDAKEISEEACKNSDDYFCGNSPNALNIIKLLEARVDNAVDAEAAIEKRMLTDEQKSRK